MSIRRSFSILSIATTIAACDAREREGAAPAPTSTPVIIQEAAVALQLAGGYVFWASRQSCPGGEFPGVCQVRYRHDDGSPGTGWNDWASRPGEPSREIASSNLAADADHLYWFDRGGDVQRLRQRVADNATVALATRTNPASVGEIAVDGQFVYWSENDGDAGAGRVYRVPKGGGARQLVVENPVRPIRGLQADGTGGILYITSIPAGLCCADLLQRASPASGGGFTFDSVGFQGVDAFTHGGGWVYFITRLGRGGRTEVRRAPLGDLGDDVLLADLGDDDALRYPAMATGGVLLFWQEQVGGLGPIRSLPIVGGTPAPFSANLPRVSEMFVGDEALFVRAAAAIHRLPFDAPQPRLDIDVDDQPLEVVQVIQDSQQRVPLVAHKHTFVRVYARLAEAEGRDQIRLRPTAVLHGWRDGAPLPGSPLLPVDRRPIHAAPAIDRTDDRTTLLFELPRSWTMGTVRLRAVANPSREAVEVDHGNNESERTVSFLERRRVCLDMLPVLTQAGVSEAEWSPQIVGHFDRATSMLPTPSVFGVWRGGFPRRIPIVDDHYNMRDTDHKNMLMMNLSVEFGLADGPAQCGDSFIIRTVTVPNSDRFGLSWGLLPYMYTLRSFESELHNAPLGGAKGMAHEIGHQMEIGHVLCPTSGPDAPAWPYATLRYATQCQIADSNDPIGFDVMTRELIVPLDAAGNPLASDTMSYGPTPKWTSDQIYDHMFERLAPVGGALAAAKAQAAPGAAPLVAGFVSPDGEVFLGHTFRASGPALEATLARLAATAQPSAEYTLVTYDAAGTQRGAWPLNVAPSSDEGDGAALGFLNVLDDDAEVGRIAVVNAVGETVAVRDGGAVAPAVMIHEPRAGDVIGATMNVRWETFDADGDTVVHHVRYSVDGGTSWHVLAANVAGGELAVDMSRMPGGDQALLEVIATDGVRSDAARVGPFVVTPRAPRAHILTEAFDELDGATGVTTRQSESITLRAYAYDADDGELDEESLSWSAEGPVVHTAVGARFRTQHLPPGSYTLKLVATDADGNTGSARTTLTVAPKEIGDAAAPVLDGRCADAAYDVDEDPMFLIDADGVLAQARAVRSGGDLHVCFSGLRDHDGIDLATVTLDPDGDGGTHPEKVDLLFSVNDEGVQRVLRGDGAGGAIEDGEARGLRAAVTVADGRWSAELRLDGAILGPLAARVRLRAGHAWDDDKSGRGAAWPAGSAIATPESWGLASFGDSPPKLTVPEDLVVPAQGPDGAVVTYAVTVADAEDPAPTVACAPASGSRFPVGTTVVSCTARDAAGNAAEAKFTVTVVPTARSRAQGVRNAVAAMVPARDLDTTLRLSTAVVLLDLSLQPALWVSGDRLHPVTGTLVYDAWKAAVDALRSIRNPSAGVLAAIAELVALSTALAETAIDDAEGAIIDHAAGSPALLAAARNEVARARASVQAAQDEVASGRPDRAILRTRDAWVRAQLAIVYARLA